MGPTAALLSAWLVAIPAADGRVTIERYRIDATQSRFEVHTRSAGLLRAFAHDHRIEVRDFAGTVELTAGSLTPASLELIVQAASLRVSDDVSERDRVRIQQDMETRVLDVERHREIRFRSTRVERATGSSGEAAVRITGVLQLHGVAREVAVDAQVEVLPNRLRAWGEIPLRQTDFGIRPITLAGGTVRVRDEVRLVFDIVAVR